MYEGSLSIEYTKCGEIEVRVDKVGQDDGRMTQIVDSERGAAAQLLLQRQLGLIDLRILKKLVEVDRVGLDNESSIVREAPVSRGRK